MGFRARRQLAFSGASATPVTRCAGKPLLTITGYAPPATDTARPEPHDHRLRAAAGDHDTARRGEPHDHRRPRYCPTRRDHRPPLLATTILPDAASLTVTGLAPAVAAALYPAPGDVRYGVIYGPDGIYTGTLRNSGGVWLRRR